MNLKPLPGLDNSKSVNSAGVTNAGLEAELVRKKATAAVLFIWATGIIFSVSLFLIKDINQNAINNLQGFDENSGNNRLFYVSDFGKRKKAEPEAFVFVRLNRKFILTNFPSHKVPVMAAVDSADEDTSSNYTKIIPKIEHVSQKEHKDFSVKPVPQ